MVEIPVVSLFIGVVICFLAGALTDYVINRFKIISMEAEFLSQKREAYDAGITVGRKLERIKMSSSGDKG